MDFFDAIDRQNIARGFAGELVRAVRGANRDREGIDTRLLHEIRGFVRVSQQLVARHRGVGAMAILFVALHGFE